MKVKIPKIIQTAVSNKYQENQKVKSAKQFEELMMKWSNGKSRALGETYEDVLARSAVELNQFIIELDEALEQYENGIY